MKTLDAYYDVLVSANVAVEAIQRAGLPVDVAKMAKLKEEWAVEVDRLERFVEAESERVGVPIKYSDKHAVDPKKMADFLYGGLKLKPGGEDQLNWETETGGLSTSEEALVEYASLKVPRLPGSKAVEEDGFSPDHPVVRAVLLIRSLSGASSRYLDAFMRTCRADGACHPKYNWALRTARLSAENPPVHQIPERANRMVADAIKSCFVPRRNPPPSPEEWDPRKHGSVFRWDIAGAEAAIRAGMFAWQVKNRRTGEEWLDRALASGEVKYDADLIAYDYIKYGKDIHSKTASLIYGVEEGTYKKGTYQRDAVGKPTFFAKIFGAVANTIRMQIRNEARVFLSAEEAENISKNFDIGYDDITQLYELDQWRLWWTMKNGENGIGYCTDAYGRRRAVPLPGIKPAARWRWDHVNRHGDKDLSKNFILDDASDRSVWYKLNEAFHTMANTPTQSTNAWDTLFMLALCYHGEYVELRVPPTWERDGVPFPEAKGWGMNEGPGPGGKPMLSWHSNTVHDSGWGDCAPGYLEPTAKLIWRRCRAVPLDKRVEADMPYRVELQVGPNFRDLRSYNKVAKEFGLEPVPDR